MLDDQDETDGKLEPPSGSDDEKETSIDSKDNMNKNEASSLVDNTHASSLVQYRSVHELETILIFDLCALSEIATSKSAILRVRLRPCSWALLGIFISAETSFHSFGLWRLLLCKYKSNGFYFKGNSNSMILKCYIHLVAFIWIADISGLVCYYY